MADSKLNEQITDAVTQTNAGVVGAAPAMAMGSLYQIVGNQWAMASLNAVYAQQQAFMMHQAATVRGVELLLSLDTD